MKNLIKNTNTRGKMRWVTIFICVALMLYGAYNPVSVSFGSCVPTDHAGNVLKGIAGKRVLTDNTFLAIGGFGLAVILGLIELVKAWKGTNEKPVAKN